MQVPSVPPSPNAEAPLQLLLFVDKRPNSREQIRQIRSYLKELEAHFDYDLQVIDVSEQPYLVEHFKLVVTPALIKIHPEPRQTLTGNNLVLQIGYCWPRWQRSVEEYLAACQTQPTPLEAASDRPRISSIVNTAELIRLSDEIFHLKQQQEELKEQLEFKDRIIAMLAHDLRNPLTAAAIAVETLELSQDPNDVRASRLTPALTSQLLKHARTQIREIDRMITDILQAARGNTTEIRVQPQVLNLGQLCTSTLEQFKEKLQLKAQRLETDIPADLPLVYADREWVRQVLLNLLDNASKYTPEFGVIQVSILHRTTQKVQVSVCDNGPGIPEADRERIFKEKVRLPRDEGQEGYGLGLSLCQRVIRAHYGQIWVDSVVNQGSCFHFTLPVYRT
ncbi:histidine kinase [Trichothermofontia sichuanensis B231]|uniref:histidine kinase n=1 Tax=Trichothermofontia sichuanensis TaxID=3045816 RepID=UPI002245636B|nr:histidine kinase [Trichothermofontia sichuanensis]UZQ53021.1 histidine kinase [Trichothermofontia sichuanensis B231]